MNRRQFLRALAGTAIAAGISGSVSAGLFSNKSVSVEVKTTPPTPASKPNIIFILVDDLGPEWISCYGADDIQTPNIDALATGGMRFTNAYSMPQCTPTRVTLMTGQYPYTHGWTNHWDVPRWGSGLHFDWEHNTTFARELKKVGYTTATAGKWQINDFRITPDAMVKHGFDEYCMWTGGEGGTSAHETMSEKRYWDPYIHTKTGSKTYQGQFGADIFTDFFIDFMGQNRNKPMCMYFPMALTHTPFTTTPDKPNVSTTLDKHKAMTEYVDYCVGRLVTAIDNFGIRENTIIMIVGDNGTSGSITGHIDGVAIKGGKGKTSESGVWTFCIANCPGRIPAGVVKDTLTDFTDMFPTFLELGGAPLPQGVQIDGHSIAKVLLGQEADGTREWICGVGAGNSSTSDFHLNTQNMRIESVYDIENRAIRDKRYKICIDKNGNTTDFYDLQVDPYENNNLVNSTNPIHVAAKEKLETVFTNEMPAKDGNPIYDPLPAQSWDRFGSYVQPS